MEDMTDSLELEDEPQDVRDASPVESEIQRGLEFNYMENEGNDFSFEKLIHEERTRDFIDENITSMKEKHVELTVTESKEKKTLASCLKQDGAKNTPLSLHIRKLALPTKRRIITTLQESGDVLPPEMTKNLMKILETLTCLTPEQTGNLIRNRKRLLKKKRCLKSTPKYKSKLKKRSSTQSLDKDAVTYQHSLAEGFVRSMLSWKCDFPYEDYQDVAKVIFKRICKQVDYSPTEYEDRKSVHIKFLADVIAGWMLGVMVDVAEEQKHEIRKEIEKCEVKEKQSITVQTANGSISDSISEDLMKIDVEKKEAKKEEINRQEEGIRKQENEAKRQEEEAKRQKDDKEMIRQKEDEKNKREEAERRKREKEESKRMIQKEKQERKLTLQKQKEEKRLLVQKEKEEKQRKREEEKEAKRKEKERKAAEKLEDSKKEKGLEKSLEDHQEEVVDQNEPPPTSHKEELQENIALFTTSYEDPSYKTFIEVVDILYGLIQLVRTKDCKDSLTNQIQDTLYCEIVSILNTSKSKSLLNNKDDIYVICEKIANWIVDVFNECDIKFDNTCKIKILDFENPQQWILNMTAALKEWSDWLKCKVRHYEELSSYSVSNREWQEWVRDFRENSEKFIQLNANQQRNVNYGVDYRW